MFDGILHRRLRVPYRLHVHIDQNPRRARATVLLLHGIGDSGAVWDAVVAKLPNTVRVISVDLLGFGQSPTPEWVAYDTRVQAQAVMATLLPRFVRHRLIVVGHSMGSLVAIELARRYPLLVRSLVLCSPPLYNAEERRRLLPNPNALLRTAYRRLIDNPGAAVTLSSLVAKLKIAGAAFHLTPDNVGIFMSALESAIVNQTSLADAKRLRVPLHMIHGLFDPLVIKKNLEDVAATRPNAHLTIIRAGHEIGSRYAATIARTVKEII